MNVFPIVLDGNAHDQGVQYGQIAQKEICKAIDFYSKMFLDNAGISWDEAKSVAKSFEADIAEHCPDGLEEMRAIATGAGVSYEDILALNCRSEILFAKPDGCSSIGFLPEHTVDGHTYLGQTWDWLRAAGDHTVILERHQEGHPSILMVVEAGMIGGKGLNSNGIGVCLNALSIGRGTVGLPLHVMYRNILESDTISNALDKIAKPHRAGSGNFSIGSDKGFLMAVEFTPENFDVLMPENEALCHTNHYLSTFLRPLDTFKRDLTDTFVRLNRMRRLCASRVGRFDLAFMQSVLADHANYPDSVCSHEDLQDKPSSRLCTVYSIAMDLNERTMWLTSSNPCSSDVIKIELSEAK